MKTLRNLMNNTPEKIADNSRRTITQVLNTKMVRKRDLNALVFNVRVKAHTEKEYYDVVIELYPLEVHKDVFKKPSIDTSAWVSCKCPYFKFYVEYALAKHGSSQIDNCNGVKPKITNPGVIPYLCKHLYSAASKAVAESLRTGKLDKNFKFI